MKTPTFLKVSHGLFVLAMLLIASLSATSCETPSDGAQHAETTREIPEPAPELQEKLEELDSTMDETDSTLLKLVEEPGTDSETYTAASDDENPVAERIEDKTEAVEDTLNEAAKDILNPHPVPSPGD